MTKALSLDWYDHLRYQQILSQINLQSPSPEVFKDLATLYQADSIIPAAVDKYRELVWQTPSNCISAKFSIFDSFKSSNTPTNDSPQTPKSVLNIAFDIIRYFKPTLSKYAKRFFLSYSSDSPVFLFDSYSFFASGHINNLCSTLSLLNLYYSNWLAVILVDKNLILFPDLLHLIVSSFKNIVLIDVTRDPIHFTHVTQYFPLDRPSVLAIDKFLYSKNIAFAFNSATFFNPCLLFTLPKVNSSAFIARDFTPSLPHHKDDLPLFKNSFSSDDSLISILQELPEKAAFFSKYSNFIVYHDRNPNFRWASFRDSIPLCKRKELISLFNEINIGIVVIGIVPPDFQVVANNVFYLCNLPPKNNLLQLHLFNASCAVVGANSGATHLSYLTDTPTIIFDSPFPFASLSPPSSRQCLLLKPLFINNQIQSPIKYYEVDPLESLINSDKTSPLIDSGFSMAATFDRDIFSTYLYLQDLTNLKPDSYHSLLSSNELIPKLELQYLRDKVSRTHADNNFSYARALADEYTLSPYNWH